MGAKYYILRLEKSRKNLKKRLDKRGMVCYNKSCVEREQIRKTILENDTVRVNKVKKEQSDSERVNA